MNKYFAPTEQPELPTVYQAGADPLRDDPVYAPQLEALIKEYYDWLAPARERTAKALETGDWASLRTLIDETPDMLAVVEPEAKNDQQGEK